MMTSSTNRYTLSPKPWCQCKGTPDNCKCEPLKEMSEEELAAWNKRLAQGLYSSQESAIGALGRAGIPYQGKSPNVASQSATVDLNHARALRIAKALREASLLSTTTVEQFLEAIELIGRNL